MKKKISKDSMILIVLLACAAVVVGICIAVMAMPVERTTKAQKYDLNCTTQLRKKPLQECKDE